MTGIALGYRRRQGDALRAMACSFLNLPCRILLVIKHSGDNSYIQRIPHR